MSRGAVAAVCSAVTLTCAGVLLFAGVTGAAALLGLAGAVMAVGALRDGAR